MDRMEGILDWGGVGNFDTDGQDGWDYGLGRGMDSGVRRNDGVGRGMAVLGFGVI